MRRIALAPRSTCVERVTSLGLLYHHTSDGEPYWDESAAYELSAEEVDMLEAATNELQARCLDACQHIIDTDKFALLGITNQRVIDMIIDTWNNEPPSIYGRFDLAYDGRGNFPKMLEYNADTPTGLLEASVIQWDWLESLKASDPSGLFSRVYRNADQFNSIHDKLVAKWRELRDYVWGDPVYFGYVDNPEHEDIMTVAYLLETAQQANVPAVMIKMDDIGHDGYSFVTPDGSPIQTLFKLYPWEWLVNEEFAKHLSPVNQQFIEPAWKMLLSNKGILPILWEMFPNHPNLLPAYFEAGKLEGNCYVKKPLLSREGANIDIVMNGNSMEATDGEYGAEGHVYQALYMLPEFDGNYPVLGSWVINGVSAGIGIRESVNRITNNKSRFVPHYFI